MKFFGTKLLPLVVMEKKRAQLWFDIFVNEMFTNASGCVSKENQMFRQIILSTGQIEFGLMIALDVKSGDHPNYECSHQITSIQHLSRHFTSNHKCQPHGGTRGNVTGLTKSFGNNEFLVPICLIDGEIFQFITENFELRWKVRG